jgi:hypothetical protein
MCPTTLDNIQESYATCPVLFMTAGAFLIFALLLVVALIMLCYREAQVMESQSTKIKSQVI